MKNEIQGSRLPEEERWLLSERLELEAQNGELRRAYDRDIQRERYSELFDRAPVGYIRLGDDGTVLEANQAAGGLLGVESARLADRSFASLVAEEDRDLFSSHLKRIFEEEAALEMELRLVGEGGLPFWAHLLTRVVPNGIGALECLVALSDITKRRLRDGARDLTPRLLVLLNSEEDFRQCMSRLCGILQEWTGCEAVGIRLKDGDDYPYYETKGFPPEHVQAENRLCHYGDDGALLRDDAGNPVLECMCGNILCGRFDPAKPFFTSHGSFWSNNTTALLASTTEVDRQARTRNRCNGEGYESVALVPMRSSGQVFGLLQFNDTRPERFSRGLISQLEMLGDNLALVFGRRQAEQALRQRESRLQTLFDDSPIGISEEDYSAVKRRLDELRASVGDVPSYLWAHPEEVSALFEAVRVLHINRRAAEILGAPGPAAIVDDPTRYRTPDSHRAFTERLIALAEGRTSVWAEIPFKAGNGEVRVFDVTLAVSPEYSHDLSRITLSFFDVTERKRAAQDLYSKNQLLENIINTSNDFIFVKDRQLRTLICNEAFARLLGKKPSDLVGNTDIENGWDPERVRGNPEKGIKGYELEDQAVLKGKTVHTVYDETIAYDGRRYVFDTIKLPLREASGEVMGCLGIGRDITALVAANEALSKRQRELGSATAELRKLNAYFIKVREEERRKVAQEIHDELGQMLTAMNLGLYWAAEKAGADASELVEHIQSLIQLNMDTIASGQGLAASLRPRVLDDIGLKAALEWLVANLRKLNGPRLSLVCDFEDGAVGPEARTAIFRLVQEALTNVLRHSKATQAAVSVRQEKDTMSISIEDDGVGISPEDRDDASSFGIIGMRERVIELGGFISVRGEAGMGSLVAIDLPLAGRAP